MEEKVVNFLQFYFYKNFAKIGKKLTFFVVKKVSQKFREIEKTYFMNVAMSFLSP